MGWEEVGRMLGGEEVEETEVGCNINKEIFKKWEKSTDFRLAEQTCEMEYICSNT